ncbi:MAG: ankyrin repeat domain-containing protein [Saprospiraceae bacterium]|nr:ankyrin repeat domain-containing protein [Saprospiraceae bacterium]
MIKKLIANVNYDGLRNLLSQYPALANEGIAFDENNTTKAHPLHRICDGVFNNVYTDAEAVEMAEIFLEFGANIEGFGLVEKKDTPLVAAASLHADEVALLYIENGANIHHIGCHGGTPLHWAAWCGRDKVVERLLKEKLDINKHCIDFKSTPLFWAMHGLKNGGEKNRHHQEKCIQMLIEAGADKNIPNAEGATIFDLLEENDIALKKILFDT